MDIKIGKSNNVKVRFSLLRDFALKERNRSHLSKEVWPNNWVVTWQVLNPRLFATETGISGYRGREIPVSQFKRILRAYCKGNGEHLAA